MRCCDIYAAAGCRRIDRFMAQRHVQFYSNIHLADSAKFAQIVAQGSPGVYPQVDHLHHLHVNGQLEVNDILLLFHQRYSGAGLVYNLDQ